MSEELKKCPFCGGEAFTSLVGNIKVEFHVVECKECRASACPFPKVKEATEAWNTRVEVKNDNKI